MKDLPGAISHPQSDFGVGGKEMPKIFSILNSTSWTLIEFMRSTALVRRVFALIRFCTSKLVHKFSKSVKIVHMSVSLQESFPLNKA